MKRKPPTVAHEISSGTLPQGYEIVDKDIGRMLDWGLGSVTTHDVGKRCFVRKDKFRIESEEERDSRKPQPEVSNEKRLLTEAERYPLPLRIAARLIADGWTEISFSAQRAAFIRVIEEPTYNNVRIAIRDIERGFTKLDKRLAELAKQLR